MISQPALVAHLPRLHHNSHIVMTDLVSFAFVTVLSPDCDVSQVVDSRQTLIERLLRTRRRVDESDGIWTDGPDGTETRSNEKRAGINESQRER